MKTDSNLSARLRSTLFLGEINMVSKKPTRSGALQHAYDRYVGDDPKPGMYTLRIAIRDRVGEQAISTDSNFFLQP